MQERAAGSPVSIGEGRFISLCVLPAASVVVARQWVDHDVAGVDAAGVEGRRVRRAGPVIRWQVGHGSRIDLVAR
jgi:hypothetical protein